MKPINFLFPATAYSFKKWLRISLIATAFLIFALIAFSFSQWKTAHTLAKTYTFLNQECDQLAEEVKQKQETMEKYPKLKAFYSSLITKSSLPHQLLTDIAHSIPEDTWLYEYTSLSRQKILLKGYTYQPASVSSFIQALSESSLIKKSTVLKLQNSSSELFSFEIVLYLSAMKA
jgi:Tfp pilus assembly protein PilN